MKRRLIIFGCLLALLLGLIIVLFFIGKCPASFSTTLNTVKFQKYDPETDGFVPNEETAAKIAEAIWLPVFGEEGVIDYKPYQVELKDGKIWIVRGTRKIPALGTLPYIEIQKSDCKILRISHGE